MMHKPRYRQFNDRHRRHSLTAKPEVEHNARATDIPLGRATPLRRARPIFTVTDHPLVCLHLYLILTKGTSLVWSLGLGVKEVSCDLPRQLQTSEK